ncbi:MAG TPA: nuclear transport factor 2 family protein [Gammaproteobacteria bacterium]
MPTKLPVLTLMFVLATSAAAETPTDPVQQVTAAETGFARTMADRDHKAFAEFVAEDAVFFRGDGTYARGREAVVADWKDNFEGTEAPFSWKPAQVVVLDNGTLALSSGPVYGRDGKQSGNFNSIWRKEADGKWRVIFDKGAPHCPDAPK